MRIPCSTTASFAWATNSSPGMLRRGKAFGYSVVMVMFSRCVRITSQLKCSTSCSAEHGVELGARAKAGVGEAGVLQLAQGVLVHIQAIVLVVGVFVPLQSQPG